MKFIDVLRISLHNIFNNKLRTLLVTIVLFILSTIIVVVTTIGVNAISIVNSIVSENMSSVANVEFAYFNDMSNVFGKVKSFSKEEIDKLKSDIYKKYPYMSAIRLRCNEYLSLELNSNNNVEIIMQDMSTNALSGQYDYLKAGRLWNKNDIGKSNIWIDQSIAEENFLEVGDTITMNFSIFNMVTQVDKTISFPMTIQGIIQYSSNFWSTNAVCDYNYLMDKGVTINRIEFTQSALGEKMNFSRLLELNGIVNKYDTYDNGKNPEGIYVYSSSASNFMMIFYLTIAIIGVVLLISVIIILLSIGCVSNSIQITVEQNAKFFGMMKAIGMRNSTVKSIVRIQALISIFIAVVLATAVTIGIVYAVTPMLTSLFASFGAEFTITISMPFYVPIVVFVGLAGMVMLFTIKSLNRISKMDVVSVISEVS